MNNSNIWYHNTVKLGLTVTHKSSRSREREKERERERERERESYVIGNAWQVFQRAISVTFKLIP